MNASTLAETETELDALPETGGGTRRVSPSQEPDAGPVPSSNDIASLAHDMRTPLTALIQALRILQAGRGGELTAVQARFVAMGLQNADALLQLSLRLQDLARWNGRAAPMDWRRYCAVTVAADLAESLQPLAEGAGIELTVERPDDGAAWGWGDAGLVREMLCNLVGNALKFTPRGGHVKVRVVAADALELRVEDDGPGLPPDEEHRLFERYYRARSERRRGSEGTGLGLAITAALARAHGGDVKARNNDGRGCTFTLELPRFGSGASARVQLARVLEQGAHAPRELIALEIDGPRGVLLEALESLPLEAGACVIDLGSGLFAMATSRARALADVREQLAGARFLESLRTACVPLAGPADDVVAAIRAAMEKARRHGDADRLTRQRELGSHGETHDD